MKAHILAAFALAITGCAVYTRPVAPVAYVEPASAYVTPYPAGYYARTRVIVAPRPGYRPAPQVVERHPVYVARVTAHPVVHEVTIRRRVHS